MNEKIGSDFENYVVSKLRDKGFWVLRIPHSRNGQPFDIIAVGNEKVIAIDCKTCLTNRFYMSRIEENQKTAMRLFKRLNPQENIIAGFAFEFADNSNVFVRYEKLKEWNKMTITKDELEMMKVEDDDIFRG